jgi:hypothetical protein
LKNNKAKARDLSAYIVDWADLSAEQRKELDNTTWGPAAPDSNKDINEPDSDESMSGNPPAGGSRGGTPGSGGGGGGGSGLPPVLPAPPPTLDDLTRLVTDIGNAIGLLAQQVTLMALQHARYPFGGIWQTFIDQFTRRFAPLNTSKAAQEALKKIQQGKQLVVEYMVQFNQYTGQTGWSDANHRQWFYDGLAEAVKDGLALTDRLTGTFEELCAAVLVLPQLS